MRKTFFSFHYDSDVWRAWNVRNSWVVRPEEQKDVGFFDGSVFEASKREGEEQLKAFLTKGLENTSVTCILSGTNTWERRWVRYEIAKSLVRGNGMLTVAIHAIANKDQRTSLPGDNPLSHMGLYLSSGSIFLAEKKNGTWVKYADYTKSIPSSSLWMADPTSDAVVPLSRHFNAYDFVAGSGRENIGAWIERAATQAGR